MATKKIPTDALCYYMSLGPKRSYQAVARRFGVSKRTVVTHATRGRWQEVVADLERERARCIQVLQDIQQKAVQALLAQPFKSLTDAALALQISITLERELRGVSERRAS